MNVGSLLLRCAQRWPHQAAVIDAHDGSVTTFAQLAHGAFALGASLRAQGAADQDRIAILGDNLPSYLLWDYGVMAAGLVRVPLDPSLSADEQQAQLADAQARVLAYGAEYAERAQELARRLPGLTLRELEDTPAAPAAALPPATPAGAAMASLNYTGGSTGKPKAVIVTHGSLASALQNIVLARGEGPGDLLLNMRPLWPIAAIIVLAHLAAGGTVLLAGRFQPQRFLELLAQYRATSTSVVPTHLVRLLKETHPADHDLSALRSIDVGAAAIPPEVFLEAIDAFGPKLAILYGLTEASWTCYQPASALADPARRGSRIHTVGRPLFGCEVRIDQDGQPAPAGAEGEVLIRGNHVAAGYWRQPELTAQAFRDGWFHTGDLGMLDDGGVLRITGRIKEVIRSGGKSILPAEVEQALAAHPAVADAAAAGLPDAEWGEIVGALVVLNPGASATEEELLEHCRQALSGFKKPRVLRFAAEIPKSHYGKVQRAKVRAMLLT